MVYLLWETTVFSTKFPGPSQGVPGPALEDQRCLNPEARKRKWERENGFSYYFMKINCTLSQEDDSNV